MVIPTDCLRHRLLVTLFACLPLLAFAQQEEDRQAFIELSASDDELYVQQQLHLRVRLYYTNNVIQGHLKDPEHPDVMIEQLGEQKQYRELLDGERYRVVERNFVLFPQKPGELQLPPIDFQGTARHPRGHQYRITDSATLFPLKVRDIPDSFSGSTWLPARSVELSEQGLDQSNPVAPGENLTRTLTLTADGLPATTLPDPAPVYPDALRAYPEPAQRQSSASEEGVSGQLQQTVALVPVPAHGGEITLPEVRIPWWDVDEDRERVAVLPARTLQVAGPVRIADAEPEQSRTDESRDSLTPPGDGDNSGEVHWVWPLLAAIFALGWLTTAVAWWLRTHRNQVGSGAGTAAGKTGEPARFARVCEQARKLDPAFFSEFPTWTGELTGRSCTTVEGALEQLDDEALRQAVTEWQRYLFGRNGVQPPDGPALAGTLKDTRKAWRQSRRNTGQGSPLPDFYPEGIRP
ncbi:protein BatD [Marinobacter sp.]|uniref:protein BatD n=1 Tax=Marinobacter sp. TaxID=50741 RepID=UPI003567E73F